MTDIILLDVDALREERLWDACFSAMPPERREKIERLRRGEAKRRSLGAGVTLDWALRLRGLSGIDKRVAFGTSGKPRLALHPELHFSLSHSGPYALCALSDGEVGADVETVRPVREALIRRVCTPAEIASLLSLTPLERNDQFCRLWTVKESLMKQSGRGLALGAETVEVSFDPVIRASRRGETYPFAFTQRALPGAWLAVCTAPEENVRFTTLTPEQLRGRFLAGAGDGPA